MIIRSKKRNWRDVGINYIFLRFYVFSFLFSFNFLLVSRYMKTFHPAQIAISSFIRRVTSKASTSLLRIISDVTHEVSQVFMQSFSWWTKLKLHTHRKHSLWAFKFFVCAILSFNFEYFQFWWTSGKLWRKREGKIIKINKRGLLHFIELSNESKILKILWELFQEPDFPNFKLLGLKLKRKRKTT